MGGALGGGATVFLYCMRERETILDLFESLTGARLLYGFHQIGGTRYDLPAGWVDKARRTVDVVEQRIGEYEAMLEDNTFFLVRTQGVGVVSRELAEDVGISGPLIRGSGVEYDVRRAEPYSSYSTPERSEEHTSELQSHHDLVCRLLLEKKNKNKHRPTAKFRVSAGSLIPATQLTL